MFLKARLFFILAIIFLLQSASDIKANDTKGNDFELNKISLSSYIKDFIDPYATVKGEIKQKTDELKQIQESLSVLRKEKISNEERLILKNKEKELTEREISKLRFKSSPTDQTKLKESRAKLSSIKLEINNSKQEAKSLNGEIKLKESRLEILAKEVDLEKNSLKTKWNASRRNMSIVQKIINSLIVIAIGLTIYVIFKYFIDHLYNSIRPKNVIRESDKALRLRTIAKLLYWLLGIVVVIFIGYGILDVFGIDTTVFVASAGVLGIAVGFAGQCLLKDLITGIFIIIEGQYRIDDVIEINGHRGLVEDINLRVTTLRDLEGKVYTIPNGEIKTIINCTKGFSYALFDLGVAYKEDLESVMDIITELGSELRSDKHFKYLIMEDLEMLGVEEFADSQVTIKFRIKTLPIKQWEVAREFRLRIKKKFDEFGIEIPFPHRTLYLGTGEENSSIDNFLRNK